MKKIFSTMLCMVILFSLNFNQASATEYIEFNEVESDLTTTIQQYFTEFYNVMLEDSIKDFSASDFDSINGYIIGKQMVFTRESYKELLNGIDSVNIEDIVINDITKQNNEIESMVYIKGSYSYNDSNETCNIGKLFRVTLKNTDNGLIVSDLNDTSIETQMIKDELTVNRPANVSNDYEAIDSIFKKKTENLQDMKKAVINTNVEPEKDVDTDNNISSVNVSYDKSTARDYAYKLGDDYENYIFKRASLDCTNFVSQCVWAGYGGTSGYTIPSSPAQNNSTCVALKSRVAKDYRMTSDWYGRNYDSIYGDPPSNFCGVTNFYDYVTGNTGNGPRGTGYNNGKIFTNLSTVMRQGDVLQFYSISAGRYYHSVMVVTTTDYSVSDYSKVRVAQHESEYNYRPLSELISNFGGTSSCKMRLIRFGSTTFSS